MTTAGNDSDNVTDNADNDDNVSTANLNTCVNSTDDNSCDYFSFDMHLVLNYMNINKITFIIELSH